jgi:mono/diheme cytochrome c family protein
MGLLALALVTAGCGGGGGDDPVARGRSVYLANCVACHNPNPKLAGPIGPALAGSSPELVRAKVMRNEYPAGYTPKRSTSAMVPLPHLEPKLDDLSAYLGSVSPSSIP